MNTPVRVSTEPPDPLPSPAQMLEEFKIRLATYEALVAEAHGPESGDMVRRLGRQLASLNVALKRQNEQLARQRAELSRAQLDLSAAEARIAAGAERRKDAIICLNALLTCEDDNLTDEAWEKRMDTVVKHARRIVSAERAAILRERDSKQQS